MKNLLIILAVFLLIASDQCSGQRGLRFVVKLGQFTQPNLGDAIVRCVGTVIGRRHILAPANCVDVEKPMEIAVIQEMKETSGVDRTRKFYYLADLKFI
jgi:hypothetical protein